MISECPNVLFEGFPGADKWERPGVDGVLSHYNFGILNAKGRRFRKSDGGGVDLPRCPVSV